jgi:hypothetical protein
MNKVDTTNMLYQIMVYLSPVIMALIAWLSTESARLIRSKIKDQDVQTALLHVDELITTAVTNTAQTFVDNIRANTKDGKIPIEAQQDAKRQTLIAVQTYIGQNAGTLAKLLGFADQKTLEQFLLAKIERCVHSLKPENS